MAGRSEYIYDIIDKNSNIYINNIDHFLPVLGKNKGVLHA